jgi:glutaredoxin 2
LQKSKLKIKQGANIIKEARSSKIEDTLEKVNGTSSKMMHISITKVHFHDFPLTHVKDRAFYMYQCLPSSSTTQFCKTDRPEA